MVESLFRPERLYLALIVSMRGGRRAPQRAALLDQLPGMLEVWNERLGSQFAARLALPTGEEIHGLLRAPDPKVARALVDVIGEISTSLADLKPVFGLGVGSLDTELRLEAIGMDGPCFHRAREGMDSARKAGHGLGARGFGEAKDEALSALFTLMGAIRSGWTRKQAAYAHAARGKMQKEVARDFGVRPSVVCESLAAARFDAVLAGESAAERLIVQAGFGFGSAFRARWRGKRATSA